MKPPVTMWGLAAALLLLGQVVAAATSYNPEQCPHTPECVCKWISGKRVADCTDAGLTGIPRTLKPDIQTLIMDGNPLTRLHKNAFKSVNLLNIQKLSLRGCRYHQSYTFMFMTSTSIGHFSLVEVGEGAFRDLKVLMELDLSRNNLTHINGRMFGGNSNLQTLRFSYNPGIAGLRPFQFPALHNLKSLDLSFCGITEIDR